MQAQAVRQSPLVAVLAARAISETGTMLSGVALPLFVLALTGSTAQLALITAVQAVPLALAGLAGGPVVDSLGSKRVSVLADLLALLAFGCIPLLYMLGWLPFPVLTLLVLAGCSAEALGMTARASLTPELAQQAGWSLERTNAAISAIGRAAIVLGPLIAGVLVGLLTPATVLLIDALTFGVSALLIGIGVAGRRGQPQATGYWAELRQGLGFLRHQPQILGLMAVFSTFNMLINPVFLVVLPVYTSSVLQNPTALGLLIACFGAGTLGGALLYGWLGPRLPRRQLLAWCFGAILVAFWPLVAAAPLWLMVPALVLMGAGVGPCGPLIMTTLAERTPPEMRGRVFGVYSAGATASIPLGVLLTGLVLDRFGIQPALLVLAVGFALLTFALLLPQRLTARAGGMRSFEF